MSNAIALKLENAAAHIITMVDDGEVEVSGTTVKVKSFDQAKQIKLGKLQRCIGFIKMGAKQKYSRMPKRYALAIKEWQTVSVRLMKLTERQCRSIASKVR